MTVVTILEPTDVRSCALPRRHRLALGLAVVLTSSSLEALAADTGDNDGIALTGTGAASGIANFDSELLKQRGFDPKLADYLKQAQRFTPGVHQVSLVVNGVKRGKTIASFDSAGDLCLDATVADAAGLKALPSGSAQAACLSLKDAHPYAQIDLRPEIGEIGLVVPQDALVPEKRAAIPFARGGTGALLNYEVFGSRADFAGSSSDNLVANTEVGLNAGDWMVRSAQSYSDSNGVSNFERRHTYAQRTLINARSLLQIGDVTMDNAVLPGALVTGVQLLPETYLSQGASGSVDGIAQSQARVDVRQSGVLIYSTVVPPGPFSLSNLPLLDNISTLQVTVTEADNSERQFSVPAASVASTATATPTGYSLTVGEVRDTNGYGDKKPWVISGSGTWPMKKFGTVSSGAMVGEGYGALGVGAFARLGKATSLNGQTIFTRATGEGVSGGQVNLSIQQQIVDRFSINASVLERSKHYRDLLDTTVDPTVPPADRSESSYSVGGNWSDPRLGSLGLAYTSTTSYQNIDYQRLTASWGRQFGRVSVSANAEWNLDHASTANDNAFYINVRIPLGSTSRYMTTTMNRRGSDDRYTVSVDDRVSDTLRYRVSAEHNTRYEATNTRVDVSMLPRYTQLDLGYSRGSDGDSGSNYGLRGGVALHGDGVTLSPYAIQDSFAIVSVGDVAGVKVNTPAGPVWTDWRGKAVVSQLNAYRVSAIDLVPKTLPRNITVDNGRQEVEAGRGSVQYLPFAVERARRVLLLATLPDGKPVPQGASVLDSKQQLVTMVTDGGEIFLTKDPAGEAFEVHTVDGGVCTLEFTLPQTPNLDDYYETAKALCRPGRLDKNKFAIGQLSAISQVTTEKQSDH